MDGYERNEFENDKKKDTHSELKEILIVLLLNPITLILSVAGWIKMLF